MLGKMGFLDGKCEVEERKKSTGVMRVKNVVALATLQLSYQSMCGLTF